jgi:hypothetical protein
MDNRILKIYGNIDNVLDYDRNIMHLLRRWSKHQIGGTEPYSLHDEFHKKVKIEFIHEGLTVRSIELSSASLYSYEEDVKANGVNNKFTLAVKQIDNDKINIIIDGKKLEYTKNETISDLIGQIRYPNKEIKLYEGKGFGTLLTIPLGAPLKLLSGKEKGSNGNTWIKVDYNGQVGWVDCSNLTEIEPMTNNPKNNDPVIVKDVGNVNTQGEPTSLVGATNEEKTWNYFIARGLTPIAAAGAMGNIIGESNFDPFKGEASGGGGWGLIQWSPADTFNNNKHKDTPSSIVAGAKSGDEDEYLLWELHALWIRGRDEFWKNLNKEISVGSCIDPIPPALGAAGKQFTGNYQGKGSAYYFHAEIERSGDMDWGLMDDGTPNKSKQYNGKWHGNIRKRPYHSAQILHKYS